MNDTLVGQSRPGRARLIPERLSQARLSQIVTALAARPGGWGDVVRFEAGRALVPAAGAGRRSRGMAAVLAPRAEHRLP